MQLKKIEESFESHFHVKNLHTLHTNEIAIRRKRDAEVADVFFCYSTKAKKYCKSSELADNCEQVFTSFGPCFIRVFQLDLSENSKIHIK